MHVRPIREDHGRELIYFSRILNKSFIGGLKIMYQIGIACIGEKAPQDLVVKARKFLESLRRCRCSNNIVLFLGGYWGLMKEVVNEAIKKDFNVVLILPVEREECPSKAICVKTSLSFKARSITLVRSVDILVVLGGASGTILEAIAAYAMGIPTIVLTNTGYPSDKLKQAFGEYIDHRKTAKIYYYDDPIEVANKVCDIICGDNFENQNS